MQYIVDKSSSSSSSSSSSTSSSTSTSSSSATVCSCVPPLVVGIAGASRSGKTTLSLGLLGAHATHGGPAWRSQSLEGVAACPKKGPFQSYSPRSIIHLDRYFKDPQTMEKVRVGRRRVRNWEVESALQWDQFITAIRREIRRHTILCPSCAEALPPEAPNSPPPIRMRRVGEEAEQDSSPPVRRLILVEGFLLFVNKEALSLIDKHIFIAVERSVARHRRMETVGTPGWYFDKLIWPSYLKYHKSILELPHQLLVIDASLDKQEVVRLAVEFIEGRAVDDAAHRTKLKLTLHDVQPPTLLSWF